MLLVISEEGSHKTTVLHIRRRDVCFVKLLVFFAGIQEVLLLNLLFHSFQRATIEPLFCRFVLPGSTVFTDGAAVYENINEVNVNNYSIKLKKF